MAIRKLELSAHLAADKAKDALSVVGKALGRTLKAQDVKGVQYKIKKDKLVVQDAHTVSTIIDFDFKKYKVTLENVVQFLDENGSKPIGKSKSVKLPQVYD